MRTYVYLNGRGGGYCSAVLEALGYRYAAIVAIHLRGVEGLGGSQYMRVSKSSYVTK